MSEVVIFPRRCPHCFPVGGRRLVDPDCALCLGHGWRWSDNVPPTTCPSSIDGMPCGRAGPLCTGCLRLRSEIGGPDDVARTLARAGGKR